jgi:hypothetical protein
MAVAPRLDRGPSLDSLRAPNGCIAAPSPAGGGAGDQGPTGEFGACSCSTARHSMGLSVTASPNPGRPAGGSGDRGIVAPAGFGPAARAEDVGPKAGSLRAQSPGQGQEHANDSDGQGQEQADDSDGQGQEHADDSDGQ